MPRLEESLDDCSHLFGKFRESLTKTGHAGIVAIYVAHARFLPGSIAGLVALFVRSVGKKLAGRIEGGYKSGTEEFFLLLTPAGDYREEQFRQDLETIRVELGRHFALPGISRRLAPGSAGGETAVAVDGVFLTHRHGENADNTLFRAFQELFGAFPAPAFHKTAEQAEIEEIIAGELIAPVYQPIFILRSGEVYGYEALSRVSAPDMAITPELLFSRSARYGLAFALEMLCRRKALVGARERGISGQLFLNVCPTLLQADEHERGITAALLDELGIERSRLTFELTERTLIEDYELFYRVLAHYRNQGYSIAIDDLGSGYAGLKMLAKLEPDYVKLDRFLIAAIDTSPTQQALVEALVTFCSKIGALVIAEGIERREELEFLVSAGVTLGQGYLLAKPSPTPFSCASPHVVHGKFSHPQRNCNPCVR